MLKYWISFALFLLMSSLTAQSALPILTANHPTLSIRDGDFLRSDYWTVSPDIPLDIYTADRSSSVKKVTFISDIDSITFEVHPAQSYDFIVLVNGKDSCLNQIKSGLTYQPSPEDKNILPDTISFLLTAANNLAVPAILNQKDSLSLMFHTAANTVILTEEAVAKSVSFQIDTSHQGTAWGGSGRMGQSSGHALQIGSFKWEDLLIMANQLSGPGTDGKFGPNLFDHKILEINFEKEQMVIHTNRPTIDSSFKKMPLVFRQGEMYIKGQLQIKDQQFEQLFMIHTGYGGTLLLDDLFVQKTKIAHQLKAYKETQLKDSFGNTITTKKVTLPSFSVDEFSLANLPLGFFEGKIGRQRKSIIGGDLLKRFNVYIDLREAYIYLKPNQLYQLPFSDV